MNRSRKLLVGVVALLALMGAGTVAQSASADDGAPNSNRWCCV